MMEWYDYTVVDLLQAACSLQLIQLGSLLQQVILVVQGIDQVFKLGHLDPSSLEKVHSYTSKYCFLCWPPFVFMGGL